MAAEGESTLRGSTTGPSTMLMSDSRCSGAIIAHPGLESWSRIARCACSRASRLRVSGYPVECTNLQVEQGAWNDSRSRRSTRQPRQTFDDFSDSLVVHVIHREVRCEGLPDRRATTRAAIATVSVTPCEEIDGGRQTDSLVWDTNPHTHRLYFKPAPPLRPRATGTYRDYISSSWMWKSVRSTSCGGLTLAPLT